MRPNQMRLAAVGLLAAQPAMAATQITLTPITVGHSTNVNATAVNKTGTIVGTYTDAKGSFGFVLNGHTATKLPPLCHGEKGFCEAKPTAINESGTVAGYYTTNSTVGFVWQDGKYVKRDMFGAGSIPFQAIILENKSGEVAFNDNMSGGDYTPFAGPPSAPQPVLGLPPNTSFIMGLNDRGTLAGTDYAEINGNFQPAIFTGTSGNFKSFAPPGAVNVAGGFINNARAVAGSYVTSDNVNHGFVRLHAKITNFEFPAGAASAAVNAINNAGRVVGVFTDTVNDQQSGFLFNGTTVTTFGQYPIADTLNFALSDRGELVLSDYATATGTYSSYRGRCSGDGC